MMQQTFTGTYQQAKSTKHYNKMDSESFVKVA